MASSSSDRCQIESISSGRKTPASPFAMDARARFEPREGLSLLAQSARGSGLGGFAGASKLSPFGLGTSLGEMAYLRGLGAPRSHSTASRAGDF